jgi:hypothetical protein
MAICFLGLSDPWIGMAEHSGRINEIYQKVYRFRTSYFCKSRGGAVSVLSDSGRDLMI